MRRIALCGLACFFVAAFAVPAAADELAEFESARRLYERQNYARAAKEFESLVGGVVPRAQNPVVRLESRKYLGASDLFLGKDEDAREQFRLLLEEDPDYDIDAVAFPEAVVATFQEVKVQFERERARREALDDARVEQERSDELEQLVRQQRRIDELEAFANSQVVEKQNSRWIAALPFGIGQFQNENRRLGIMFAVMESAFLAASIATFIGHNSLRNENPAPDEIDRAQRVERALRIGNWVSVAGLVAFYTAGVVEAQVRFRPVIRSTRPQAEPEPGGTPPIGQKGPTFRLQLGLTGGRFQVDF